MENSQNKNGRQKKSAHVLNELTTHLQFTSGKKTCESQWSGTGGWGVHQQCILEAQNEEWVISPGTGGAEGRLPRWDRA